MVLFRLLKCTSNILIECLFPPGLEAYRPVLTTTAAQLDTIMWPALFSRLLG